MGGRGREGSGLRRVRVKKERWIRKYRERGRKSERSGGENRPANSPRYVRKSGRGQRILPEIVGYGCSR